jgi:predicted O-methyltransferase YrrM
MNELQKITILEYFESNQYEWKNDLDQIKNIALLTKTRVDEFKDSALPYGIEQTFLIKSIAKNIKAKNFFEIGSGRGTASFAVSLEPSIQNIYSFDKFPRFLKQDTAINYKPVKISLNKIKKLIPYNEKSKIKFIHILLIKIYRLILKDSIDLCFIDGNHDDYKIIMNDFLNCLKVVNKKAGVILFDDYSPDLYVVKKVVDDILKKYKFKAQLIQFRGHIFKNGEKELGSGIVMIQVSSNS